MIASTNWPCRFMEEGDIQTADRELLEAGVRHLQEVLVKIESWGNKHLCDDGYERAVLRIDEVDAFWEILEK